MQAIENVIIAAAGRGKRLGHGMPKCLVNVNGIPIINYLLYLVRDIPNVRIVVGYCENDVIEHVRAIRDDVVFVRNPNFRHTATLQSLALAARGLDAHCLCMDGDMIVKEDSFAHFIKRCSTEKSLIAVSEEIMHEPVYAHEMFDSDSLVITGFDRKKKSNFEWANIAYLPSGWLAFEATNFFERLQKFLPLPALSIRRIEVDTFDDLSAAENILRTETNYCGYLSRPK